MTKPDCLIDLGALIKRERWWLSDRQHLDTGDLDLDVSSCQFRIRGVFGTPTDLARHLHHIFAAKIVTSVYNTLDNTTVITQINKHQVLAVLTTTVDPSANSDNTADIRGADKAAHVSAHRG